MKSTFHSVMLFRYHFLKTYLLFVLLLLLGGHLLVYHGVEQHVVRWLTISLPLGLQLCSPCESLL